MIFPGRPVGYVRMTKAAIWRPDAQNYLGYRNALADAIRAAHPTLLLDAPLVSDKTNRNRFVKAQRARSFRLAVWVYAEDERGDLSNFIKTVEDAIQASDVIFNDSQIKQYFGDPELFVDRANPRVHFILEERLRVVAEEGAA